MFCKSRKIDKATGEHIKSNKFVFGLFEDPECTKLIKEAGANEFEGSALLIIYVMAYSI